MDVSALTFVDAIFAYIYDRYFVSPYTYLTEGLLSQGTVTFSSVGMSTYRSFLALAHFPIVCSSAELVTLIPPAGQTCGAYLQNYINRVGGSVQDPSATLSCQFCSFATTDQLLSTNFHMFYSHRWRNVGFLVGYTFVNVRFMYLLMNRHYEAHFLQIALIYILTYLFRIRTGSLLGSLKRQFGRKSSWCVIYSLAVQSRVQRASTITIPYYLNTILYSIKMKLDGAACLGLALRAFSYRCWPFPHRNSE